MKKNQRYEPCECGGQCLWLAPYRCAVEFVLRRFGIDPNCECRTVLGPVCIVCESRGDRDNDFGESALPAFQVAAPPYRELARSFAGYAGCSVVAEEEGIFVLGRNDVAGLRKLIAASSTDAIAFDAALFWVAEAVRFNRQIPDELREWAYWALTGRITRPKLSSKYPPALIERDRVIVGLVKDVVQLFRLKATSSDADGGESACSAVAKALSLNRLEPNRYSAIRRVWQRRDRPRDLPTFLRD